MEPSSAPWRVVDAPPATQTGQPSTSTPATAIRPVVVLAAAGAIVVLLGAAIVIAAGGLPGTVGDAGGVVIAASDPPMAAGQVVVDVDGAVTSPGVYRLPAGSRVGDAVAAAGGFGPRVDAARAAVELNLAAVLEDGAQIIVPSRDDAVASVVPGGGGVDEGSGGGTGSGDLLDLNAATQAELEALPGIGPVTATKIIDSRAAEPFATVDDLRTRKLVGAKTFEALRDLVTVR